AYIAGEVSGSRDEGGIEFHLEIEGVFTVPGNGGDAEFVVYDYDDLTFSGTGNNRRAVWPPTPTKATFHFTRFDVVDPDFDGELLSPPWEVQSGIAVPPTSIVVAGYRHNDGSNVAATVSQTLVALSDQNALLPPGAYPVEYNSPGAAVGAYDFSCRITG